MYYLSKYKCSKERQQAALTLVHDIPSPVTTETLLWTGDKDLGIRLQNNVSIGWIGIFSYFSPIVSHLVIV